MAKGAVNGRVTKRGSSSSSAGAHTSSRRHTRQRSRLTAEASSSASGSGLLEMINEAISLPPDSIMDEVVDEEMMVNAGSGDVGLRMVDSVHRYDTPMECQGNGEGAVSEKRFPLMDLPAEIRNEIYRACLTRPFNILLSRKEQPPPVEPEARDGEGTSDATVISSDSDGEEEGEDLIVQPRHGNLTQSFPLPPPAAGSSAAQAGNMQSQASRLHTWASRSARPIRLLGSRSSSSTPVTAGASSAANVRVPVRRSNSRTTRQPGRATAKPEIPRAPRPQDEDPLIVTLLRVSKTVYQEARSILYNENLFTLDLDTALPTLAALHQRSRRQIKHVELEIPCYNEILERFQETVRLSLRYCWGLKKFVIHMPFTLPGADGSGTTGNTTVYANGFDILRWLPRQCEVALQGNICTEIEAVVSKNAKLARTLDEGKYGLRQLVMVEAYMGNKYRSVPAGAGMGVGDVVAAG